MTPVLTFVPFVGFLLGAMVGMWINDRGRREEAAMLQRLLLVRANRHRDVLLSLRDLIAAGDTTAACQLIDTEVTR